MKQYLFMSELLCFFHLISMSNFLLLYSVWNKTELQIIYLATINKYLTIYSCTCISWSSTSTRSIVQIRTFLFIHFFFNTHVNNSKHIILSSPYHQSVTLWASFQLAGEWFVPWVRISAPVACGTSCPDPPPSSPAVCSCRVPPTAPCTAWLLV